MKGMNLQLVMGIVTIAIAFIVFPIILTADHSILNDANIADFTGLGSVAAVAPLVIFVAMIFSGGLLTFQGVKASKSKKK